MHYDHETLMILFLMILTNAAGNIGNKVYFQLGYDDPLLVVVLVLISQSGAVLVYRIAHFFSHPPEDLPKEEDDDQVALEIQAENGGCLLPANLEEENPSFENGNPHSTTTNSRRSTWQGATAKRHRAIFGSNLHKSIPLGHRRTSVILVQNGDETRRQDVNPVRLSTPQILALFAWSPEDYEDEGEHADTTITAPTTTATATTNANQSNENEATGTTAPGNSEQDIRRGSRTGLNQDSKKAVAWVHRLPHWSYPIITSFLNMLNILFRTFAILYLPASIASMMFGGLRLVAGILAGKIVRKRYIMRERWCGAAITTLGLVLVGLSEFVGQEDVGGDDEKDENGREDKNEPGNFGLGMMFVLLKVSMGVFKSLCQELFIQEACAPATLLLGLEGIYGTIVALPLYFAVGPALGYDPVESFKLSFGSGEAIGYSLGFMLIIFCGCVYNVLALARTSSMSRNMWKNFSGLVVSSHRIDCGVNPSISITNWNDIFLVALGIFYATGNEKLGEEWIIPGSLFILVGYSIMMLGICVYYGMIACLMDDEVEE